MGKQRYLKRIIRLIKEHGPLPIIGIHEHLLSQMQPRLNSTYRNNPSINEISNILSKNTRYFTITGTYRHYGREVPIWGLVDE